MEGRPAVLSKAVRRNVLDLVVIQQQNLQLCVELQLNCSPKIHKLQTASNWLLVKVLHPTPHKTDHFGDVRLTESKNTYK